MKIKLTQLDEYGNKKIKITSIRGSHVFSKQFQSILVSPFITDKTMNNQRNYGEFFNFPRHLWLCVRKGQYFMAHSP
jgi:hypothetical protein